jgi:RHS repeat-associated protein
MKCGCFWSDIPVGRLNTTTDLVAQASLITGSVYSEQRTYNVMGQLTWLSNNSVNINYSYSATQNNGKITGQTDNISGEQVVYAYDALNRLASAGATSNSWGQTYSYDGFGNLTDQIVTAGSAPSLSTVYSASNNRQGDCADANGNINSTTNCSGGYGYDVSNRIVSVPGGTAYGYAPGNKRIWRGTSALVGGYYQLTLDELTFWSVNGQKLATYNISGDPSVVYSGTPSLTVSLVTSNYYFGRKLIKNGNGYVGSDRLGSIGKYYPYGQEKPSATTNGTEKFTGYFRDAETGLDYAKNRYHQPGLGRFLTVDPYLNSAGPTDPGSWNRYAYTRGDPVNRIDPHGQEDCPILDGSDTCACVEARTARGPTDDLSGSGGGNGCDPPGSGGGGGGGEGPAPPGPSCEDSLNQRDINYVEQNAGAAYGVSAQVGGGVSGGFILAWAAVESIFGTSSVAQNNNNYFGEKFLTNCGPTGTTCVPNSNPNATAPWAGAIPCANIGSPNPGFACFAVSALGGSALAALSTGNGKYLKAAESAGGSVAQMAQAIANAGWCKEGSCTNGGYGAAVQADYNELLPVLACLFPGMGLH